MLKKDKQKVLGEVFDEERIRGFLAQLPPPGQDADFAALERAYRGMSADAFATFVRMFVQAGRRLDARNAQGRSVLELVESHPQGAPYAAIIRASL